MRQSGLMRGVLGVLGGMGPAATADLYSKLIRATPALCDQEHIPVVVLGDPRIPDRSIAIESGCDQDVLVGMLRGLRCLESVGVGAIAIPCNTAHFWIQSLQDKTSIPIISIIESAITKARQLYPEASTATVLGTRSTVSLRLYDAGLRAAGFDIVQLTERQQEVIDVVIWRTKKGDLRGASDLFDQSAQLWGTQADIVFLACTELPLIVSTHSKLKIAYVDSTEALASACVAWAMSPRNE